MVFQDDPFVQVVDFSDSGVAHVVVRLSSLKLKMEFRACSLFLQVLRLPELLLVRLEYHSILLPWQVLLPFRPCMVFFHASSDGRQIMYSLKSVLRLLLQLAQVLQLEKDLKVTDGP